jgi:malonyl CoA-acyl carrier protein transacylase
MSDQLIFIQFAGQGVKYMEDLRRMYATCPGIRPFMRDAIAEIKTQAALYDDSRSGFFKYGLDVDAWMECPEKTPDLGYLLSSPLSHPLIYLTQISSYLSLMADGVDPTKLLERTHSATGFSTGVVAAILVSMGLPFDELCRLALKVQAMFVWQGIRCQESMLGFEVNPRLEPEMLATPHGSPSCMANINNMTRGKLDAALAAFSGRERIYPAYELFPGRWIVSGLPEDLAAFSAQISQNGNEATWRYVPSTIGAHSPFLAHAFETSPRDAGRLGVAFPSADMKIPVWSNDTGEDLRQHDDILMEVMRAYFLYPAVWRKQIKPVLPTTDIRYVLDFGPGTGVATLTENHCSTSGVNVVRCTIPMGRKKLLEEILPELGI